MSEYAISISNLNDFVFCPASIYFHALDSETDNMVYQCQDQLNGTAAHRAVDAASYSSDPAIMQGSHVYSEKYDLIGRVDTFHIKEGLLRERKKKIKVIYDGYVFQLYAQCVSLREMGYAVNRLSLYSMDDNKTYPIPLPEDDTDMFGKFEALVERMKNFSLNGFVQETPEKCRHCIYEPLCPFSLVKEEQ